MNSEVSTPTILPNGAPPLKKQKIILFSCQMIIIFIVVVSAILNLSLDNGNKMMWTSLLSSTLGYALPSPKLPSLENLTIKKNVKI